MTTGSETQSGSDIPWQIPEDWVADLQSGHIMVAPANIPSGALSPRGYTVYAHDERPPPHPHGLILDPDRVREAFGFLERTGYTYQGFRPWLYQSQGEDATAYQRALAIAQCRDRLAALRDAAEDDGIPWNEDSAQDFLAFISDNPHWRSAGLALMDSGNLRAVWEWESDDETHLALQFLGSKSVQFVIFKRRPGAGRVSKVTGTDSFNGINFLVMAFQLAPLVHLHDKP